MSLLNRQQFNAKGETGPAEGWSAETQTWATHGLEGCDDCQWIAHETDGDILICPECDGDVHDGQPDWAQEWHDFDPDC